ncbi:DUF2630 family protein [Streptomyces sp. NPDC088921]|uniref:DUF2630 family protein n=1 Tax=unclassified Streptomyces TaxID=2593676 RepID=UPI00342DF9F1
MDQGEILGRIAAMVEQERKLRDSAQEGQIDTQEEKQRLGELERELDQCWDLLRQRRAKAEFGQDPDEAHVRPASQVENYLS